MQELSEIEVDSVSGGLAFLPLLAVIAVGSFAGGYVAAKIAQWVKS